MEVINDGILPECDFEPVLTNLDGDEVFTREAFQNCLGRKLDELPPPDNDVRDVDEEGDDSDSMSLLSFVALSDSFPFRIQSIS